MDDRGEKNRNLIMRYFFFEDWEDMTVVTACDSGQICVLIDDEIDSLSLKHNMHGDSTT